MIRKDDIRIPPAVVMKVYRVDHSRASQVTNHLAGAHHKATSGKLSILVRVDKVFSYSDN